MIFLVNLGRHGVNIRYLLFYLRSRK